MPRFRNEEAEQSHYVDGDVVWVKIHNTEIWWPGEVTSSQDFRFVNASRPPFAVVAFFNEKTFEQVKSAKLIYPFQCAHKEEFIRLGTSKYKKSDGHNMGDKFNEDVAIAEARFPGTPHQLSSLHTPASSSARPDSLIKALLSSSSSSSQRNSSTRSSSGVPSPAASRQPEPTFRIMDIGSTYQSRRERRVDDCYDCHMCNFRTTSMDVLLIHRRGHMESSSSYSSNNSTTNSSTSLGKRATRRANTTNAFDLRHLSERQSRDSTHFLPNSVRCHSRHVSIVVDASLTDEEQQRVANIAQQTMKSIERVVHPSSASSSASASTSSHSHSHSHSHSRRRSIRNSCSSQQQTVSVPSACETPRRNTQNPRDPRSQRSNQLRATMPAPQPPPPPAKQRRLTRSMSRLQQGTSQATTPELPPPPLAQAATPRRSAGRRRTLAVTAAPSESPPVTVPRRSNPMRKTLTAVPETPVSAGRRKRTLARSSAPKTPTISPSPPQSPPPQPPGCAPATAAAALLEAENEEAAAAPVPVEEPPAPKKPRPETPAPSTEIHPQQQPQQANNFAGSLELQRSLMAEWCDDEMDELPEQEEHSTPNGRKAAMEGAPQEPKRPQQEDDEPKLAERTPAKKRIRNIPKKDRRDVVRQEFDVEPDEPIVIPDSDASSNESVVFVDDEPRQRRKKHAAAHHSSNGSEKSKSTSTSTSTSTPKATNNSSCFDFEEEDDLQQQQQNEGQNGLSYRRRTQTNRWDMNGKGPSEVESPEDAGTEAAAGAGGEAEEAPAEPTAPPPAPDDLFMGFDEVHEEGLAEAEEQSEPAKPEQEQDQEQEDEDEDETVAEALAEPEAEEEALLQAEAQVEAEAEAEEEGDVEPGDHLSLPIKERQKRIFKSRNRSTVAAPREEDLAVQEEEQEEEQPPANGNGAAADQPETEPEPELCNGEEEEEEGPNESNNLIANSSERSRPKDGGKRRDKTKTESSSRRQQRRPKAKTTRQQSRTPTPVPVPPEELSNNSSSTTTSSSSSSSSSSRSSASNHSSNSNSNSHSHSNHLSRPSSSPGTGTHDSGLLSPVLSSSNSCSIASNIAVISPEEARELQRSASGAGLIHAAIVDATQPVQRGGVLILEDIRLPNLYEPFGSLSSSSVSNDSRRPISRLQPHEVEEEDDDDERSQDSKASQEEQQQAVAGSKLVRDAGSDYDAAEEHRDAESLLNDSSRMADEVTHSHSPDDESSLAHAAEVLHYVSQPREVLLKKREQELLRQYKADLASGQSAEKCRKARERWSRTMRSTEEKEPPDALEQEEEQEQDAASEAAPLQATEDAEELEEVQYEQETFEHQVKTQQQQQAAKATTTGGGDESRDSSLDAELASIELVLPSNLYQRRSRRCVSHPNVNLAAVSGRKASGQLGCDQTLCDADVAKAHQQLVDLREQQRRRYSPAEPTAPPATQPEPRRQRRRSRNQTSSDMVECTFRFDVADEASCETKEVQESLTPQLCADRICAVMTRPIPGYNHTFMLCSLANNNFTPLNNVALYLDSEKNHLVPVPREALLEPPRLADGHPLSAVFADIDILGDEAVAQAMEPVETETDADAEAEADAEPDLLQDHQNHSHSHSHSHSQSQSQDEVAHGMSTVQILLSDSENGEDGGVGGVDDGDEEEPVETLGIMTPLSQVAEGGALAASSYVSEDGQLSLHDDQVDSVDSNILQLNVNGHRLELDPSMLFSIAEQPDSCIELSVAETSPSAGVCGVGSTTAVLHARDILQAAQVYLQERDLQLVNVEDMTLDGEEALAVPVTDLLSQALAGSQVVGDDADFVDAANAGVGMLHIDTRTAGGVVGGVGGGDNSSGGGGIVEPGVSVVYISHALPPPAAHLTPPITARTNETNALLDQTPIMSTLENPSGGMQLRRVSPLAEGNLEDSLAVIGVTNGSGVPTSLELPITVTNPAIAPRVTAPTPIVDMVQFAPFQ